VNQVTGEIKNLISGGYNRRDTLPGFAGTSPRLPQSENFRRCGNLITSRHGSDGRAFFVFWTIGTTGMPLTRGEVLRFDVDRTAFEFTMLDVEGGKVRCQISGAAMDELAGARGTPSSEREAQFMSLRDAIERVTSEKFDRGGIFKGAVVRVFVKDIPATPQLSNSVNHDQNKPAPGAGGSGSSG
jgi:hypothetical protein